MKEIEILDCTLRDGGYVNDWQFGQENIGEIIKSLTKSGINYIECGFIDNTLENYDRDKSIYKTIGEIDNKLIENNESQYTVMMVANKYDIDKLDYCSNNCKIIRLSFHKKDIDKIDKYIFKIKEKGYKVFLQPTIIMRYTDEEIIDLLNKCNDYLKPDGVAIVDTLGEMMGKDMEKLTLLFDQYLNCDIKLLFHGHNNMQLAFSNAINFIENVKKERNIIIDVSLMGMGRDAGNLCTEMMLNYLNKYWQKQYDLYEILNINDLIKGYKKKFRWGYSPEYLLNAYKKTHPNYGKFFTNEIENISLQKLNSLLDEIPEENKNEYDENIANFILYNNRKD